MTLARVFYVIAAVVLFLGGIEARFIPNPLIWGLFYRTRPPADRVRSWF